MTRRRIAVIGGGVSGITASYILSFSDYVTLFEADSRLGGHADTHVVGTALPPIGVDTGFIVYNERTYPLLTRMFAELGVATQAAQMSMSVRRVRRRLLRLGFPRGRLPVRRPGGPGAGRHLVTAVLYECRITRAAASGKTSTASWPRAASNWAAAG